VAATYGLPLEKIAVSHYIREAVQANHGVVGIHVVANGVDTGHFNRGARRKTPGFAVGFLYQVAPRKNVGLALRVIGEARRQFPDLRVLAFGQSPASEDLPMPGWVDYHINPPQDIIPSIYASCDAWLFTSTTEGFGLPILESMASGTPVIATRAGAAPDLIDGRNGVLVDAGVDAFLVQLRRFHDMTDREWMTFSDAARATARENSWEIAADRLEKLLGRG
jgi:glycosyltransferase involved in cell wall biosynthesis